MLSSYKLASKLIKPNNLSKTVSVLLSSSHHNNGSGNSSNGKSQSTKPGISQIKGAELLRNPSLYKVTID